MQCDSSFTRDQRKMQCLHLQGRRGFENWSIASKTSVMICNPTEYHITHSYQPLRIKDPINVTHLSLHHCLDTSTTCTCDTVNTDPQHNSCLTSLGWVTRVSSNKKWILFLVEWMAQIKSTLQWGVQFWASWVHQLCGSSYTQDPRQSPQFKKTEVVTMRCLITHLSNAAEDSTRRVYIMSTACKQSPFQMWS